MSIRKAIDWNQNAPLALCMFKLLGLCDDLVIKTISPQNLLNRADTATNVTNDGLEIVDGVTCTDNFKLMLANPLRILA